MFTYFRRHRRQRTAAAAALEAFEQLQREQEEAEIYRIQREQNEEPTEVERVEAPLQLVAPAAIINPCNSLIPLQRRCEMVGSQSNNCFWQKISGLFGSMQFGVNLLGCLVCGYLIYNFAVGDEQRFEAVFIRRGIFD